MGMILRIASSRIVGQRDIVGRSGYFSLNLSANSVMRGRLDARRTLKSLVADLRINRKQKLIPYFLGENCSRKIKTAAHMEILQRKAFTILLTALPKMPILFYRIIHKFPDLRNLILR